MNTINTNHFISEKRKFRPVTNAEFDEIMKKTIGAREYGLKKLKTFSFNDIKEGRVVRVVRVDEKNGHDINREIHIVFDSMKLPGFIAKIVRPSYCFNGNMIMVVTVSDELDKFGYRALDFYKKKFPLNDIETAMISEIYDSNMHMSDIQDPGTFKTTFASICETIKNM